MAIVCLVQRAAVKCAPGSRSARSSSAPARRELDRFRPPARLAARQLANRTLGRMQMGAAGLI